MTLGNDLEGAVFLYKDTADRALLELALQIVGEKMGSEQRDAASVAMQIVSESVGIRDFGVPSIPRLEGLLMRVFNGYRKEELSGKNEEGQGLLHFAVILGMWEFVGLLVMMGVDGQDRDNGGFTSWDMVWVMDLGY